MRRYGWRDDQWERIEHRLPGKESDPGATAKDNSLFVEAVLYRYRAGIPWRDLPERFGDFRVVHTRHTRWSEKGVWQQVFEVLAEDADNEYAAIDATIVRAHQHRAGAPQKKPSDTCETQAIGRSSGGLSTKIHATGDALGNPTGFHLTPGQAHDLQGADVLLDKIDEIGALLADKAYDAEQRVLERLTKADCQAVIPPKSNRTEHREYDNPIYKWRHLIENLFQKLKQYRALATRYDKTARNFLGAIYLAAAVIWLN